MRRTTNDPFGSTHWSVVLAATGNDPGARNALEILCQSYWLPVYGYVRSRTACPEDAADRTQAFFAHLLERNALAVATPERGRFRAFLVTALKNFLASEHQRANARKRGGQVVIGELSIDVAENRLSSQQSSLTPEQEFDRRWAVTVIETALRQLENEQNAAGRSREFARLRPFLTGQAEYASQSSVAEELGISPEALRSAVYRLRRRYRTLLRAEVAQTVESPGRIEEEIHWLIAAISG